MALELAEYVVPELAVVVEPAEYVVPALAENEVPEPIVTAKLAPVTNELAAKMNVN